MSLITHSLPHRQSFSTMPSGTGLLGSFKNKIKRRSTAEKKKFLTSPSNQHRPSNQASASPNEPPPAYTPDAVNALEAPVEPRPSSDGRYAFLRTFDTIFIIDDSASMIGRSWGEVQAALAQIAPICTHYDADGIDIHFLNARDNPFYHNVKSTATVNEIFSRVQPRAATPTGQKLHSILKPYLAKYAKNPDSIKPLNIIVITDGAPSDDVESTIISAAKKLDKLDAPAWQVGIQFFQVGNDSLATNHLRQLDEGLADLAGDEFLRDIVDTVPLTSSDGGVLNADGILKVVLGAVTRRLDRNHGRIHSR